MHAVVVDHLPGDAMASARALAAVLGKTVYDCRPIAQAPGGGPAVVSCHAEPQAAQAVADSVRAAGFDASVVPGATAHGVRALAVRNFSMGPAAMTVEPRQGESIELRYDDVDVLVRGSELTRDTQTQTKTTRKLDVGRAVLTGGLMMTRKHKAKRTTSTTDSEGFLIAYSRSVAPVALLEKSMLYQSLGSAMQPSRMANFSMVVRELRQRSAGATWDERLLRRTAQQQMLGPTLNADDHLDLAIALIAASIRGGRARPVPSGA